MPQENINETTNIVHHINTGDLQKILMGVNVIIGWFLALYISIKIRASSALIFYYIILKTIILMLGTVSEEQRTMTYCLYNSFCTMTMQILFIFISIDSIKFIGSLFVKLIWLFV